MNNIEQSKKFLIGIWDEQVTLGLMTEDEMRTSLQAEVDGLQDLSSDELDEEIASLFGWDIDEMTDNQWDEWRKIQQESAKEWLVSHPAINK